MQFKLRGREYIIEKRLPDGSIRIKDIVTDERSAMPELELIEGGGEIGVVQQAAVGPDADQAADVGILRHALHSYEGAVSSSTTVIG